MKPLTDFESSLNQCLEEKATRLSTWDRITAADYYKTGWLRQCQTEVSGELRKQLDSGYLESTAVDLKFREQLNEIDQAMTPNMGQEMAGHLGQKALMIHATSNSAEPSTTMSDAPTIRTVTGYSTRNSR